MSAIQQQILEAVECPRCGAPVGAPCTWKIKRPSDHVHLDRVKLIDAQRGRAS